MKKSKTMIAFFLAPAILFYLIVFMYPTLRTLLMSFFRVESIAQPTGEWQFSWFENYRTLFGSYMFVQSMKNLFKIWFFGGAGVLFFAMILAVILTRGIKFKRFWRSIIYLPNVISAVAMGTLWVQYIYSPKFGLLKNIFEALGLNELAKIEYTSPDHIFASMTVAFCFGIVGYFMLMLMAGIERIPIDYFEAATLEGANVFQQFFKITLPLLKDVIRSVIVLWTVNVVGFFIWSQMFSQLNMEEGTVTPMVYMYQLVFGSAMTVSTRDVGAGAAVGVLMSLIVVFVFFLVNLLIRDDKLEY